MIYYINLNIYTYNLSYKCMYYILYKFTYHILYKFIYYILFEFVYYILYKFKWYILYRFIHYILFKFIYHIFHQFIYYILYIIYYILYIIYYILYIIVNMCSFDSSQAGQGDSMQHCAFPSLSISAIVRDNRASRLEGHSSEKHASFRAATVRNSHPQCLTMPEALIRIISFLHDFPWFSYALPILFPMKSWVLPVVFPYFQR